MIIVNIIIGIFIGGVLGSIDIFLKKLSNRNRSFRFYVLTKSFLYIISFVILLNLLIGVAASIFLENVLNITAGEKEKEVVRKIAFTLVFYSAIVSILISFISEVNKKFGPGILLKLFLGKYHNPKVEEKIFMFLDLKSSTTYAEKLGHIRYSELIQDCFTDLNSLVLKYKAEIYQYVGDEAVLTWTIKEGLEDANYLHFYFAFRDKINSKAEYYKEKYGLVPEFKAGVNGGDITVAEIGDIKREIAYHGDVINTAARIQGECNTYNEKLIISEFLAKKINRESKFVVTDLSTIRLKGKKNLVKIYRVSLS